MEQRLDKTVFSFGSHQEHDRADKKYWAKATYEEKVQTITYLRECFYGQEATTGRLQRIYTFLKR